jgi:hypothetical protein
MYRYSTEERVAFLVLYGKKYLSKIFLHFSSHTPCVFIYIFIIYIYDWKG